MDAVDKHWTAHLKTCFVLFMAGRVIWGTIQAAKQWNDTKKKNSGYVQLILLFNILAVLSVTIYKFTSKHIAPLFSLQCMSHYSFFLTFTVLIHYSENQKIKTAGLKILKKMRPLHGFYLASIFIGFFFTECKSTNVYPTTFLVSASLFCITYYLCNTLKMEEIEAAWDKNLSEKDAAEKNLT